MLYDLFLLVIGIGLLWVGSEAVINAAIAISRHYRLSEGFIALTVLAIGTDLPEIVVSVKVGLNNLSGIESSGIITGNAIGSIIAQTGLVLGAAGLAGYLTIGQAFLKKNIPFLIISLFLLFVLGFNGSISKLEGLLLLLFYLVYFYILYQDERSQMHERSKKSNSIILQWLSLIAGMALLIFSADMTVESAKSFAKMVGASEALIGIAIIGVGTSLPELFLSINALMKKKAALSVGNIIGSNIFDTLVPIGLAALIAPLAFDKNLLYFDLPFLLLLTAIMVFMFFREKGLQKREAKILLVLYIGYILVKVIFD